MSEIPFDTLLAKDGCVRAALKSTLQWGDWADIFCDELLSRMNGQHVEDLVEKYGAFFVSYGGRNNDRSLNVRWKEDHGFCCYKGPTLDAAYSALWHETNLRLNANKEQPDESSLSSNAVEAVAPEILPWRG